MFHRYDVPCMSVKVLNPAVREPPEAEAHVHSEDEGHFCLSVADRRAATSAPSRV